MRFMCDAMLAHLGRWLRMFGYDTKIAAESLKDEEVLEITRKEKRFLLTRDKQLFACAKKVGVDVHYFKARGTKAELDEIAIALDLKADFPEKSLCPACGGILLTVAKEKVKGKLPGKVQEPIWQCESCGKLYWRGGHWKGITERARSLKRGKKKADE
jgi:hypothetical protein